MKFHCNWLNADGEAVLLFGLATGRVNYEPEAQWLYSFRLFLGVFKIEMCWKTGYTGYTLGDEFV